MKDNPNVIDRFTNEYRYLSNFYESPNQIKYKGLVYTNAEAAFQAQKCTDLAYRFTKLNPRSAKRLGRSVMLRPDWDTARNYVMADIVRAKFYNNNFLTRALLNTGDATLIEGNTWGDTYWGVCDGVGKNNLGKILMMVRDELREKYGKEGIDDD